MPESGRRLDAAKVMKPLSVTALPHLFHAHSNPLSLRSPNPTASLSDTLLAERTFMPTEKQSAASRANSQHSTGPRTAEGRAKSRFNALKHGIFAESQIIFTESAEDLAELTAEYHEHYLTANPAERCLVDALIETEWRLRRMPRVEAGIWEDKHGSLVRYKAIVEKDPGKRGVTPSEIYYADDSKFATLQRVI